MGRSLENLLSILVCLLPACLGYPWLLGCYYDDGWRTAPSASVDAIAARGRCLERCQDVGNPGAGQQRFTGMVPGRPSLFQMGIWQLAGSKGGVVERNWAPYHRLSRGLRVREALLLSPQRSLSKFAVTDQNGRCRCVRTEDGIGFPLQDLDEDCNVRSDDFGCHDDEISGGEKNEQSVYLLDGPRLKSVNVTVQPENVFAGDSLTVKVDVTISSSEIAGGWPNGTRGRLIVTWFLADECDKLNAEKIDTNNAVASFVWVKRFYIHGTYVLGVSVSTGGGVVSSRHRLTVHPPIPTGLQVTLDPEVRDTPTCVPSHLPDDHVTVYTGTKVRFIASLDVGLNLRYAWAIDDKVVDITLPSSNCSRLGCRKNYLGHSFSLEGVSKVAVNVSNSHGWAHQLIHVVAVNYQLIDARISIADGDRISTNNSVALVIAAYTTRHIATTIHIEFGDDSHLNRSLQTGRQDDIIVDYNHKCNLEAKLQHTYRQEGDYVVTVVISDGLTHADAHTSLKVCNTIDQGKIIGEEVAATHSPVELSVHLTTATLCPLKIKWRVYNSTGLLMKTARRTRSLFWHPKFRFSGSYKVEATVEGAINSLVLGHTILVQEPVRGLSIDESASVCQTGRPCQIDIAYAAGNDVTCRWSTHQMSGRHVIKSPNGCRTTWTFHKPETLVINVVVSNLVSRKGDSLVLNVVEPLHGLYLCVPKRIASGSQLDATVFVLKGSHFNVTADDALITSISNKTYSIGKLINTPGTVNLTVNVRNSISELSTAREIEVVENLQGAPSFRRLRKNEESRVYIGDDLQKENLLYTWKLSDGHVLYTGVPVVEASSEHGPIVSLSISNEVSSVDAHAWNQKESISGTPHLVHNVVATADTETDFLLQDIPLQDNYNQITVTYIIKERLQTTFQTYVKAISTPSSFERWSHYFPHPCEVTVNVTLSSGKTRHSLTSVLSVQQRLTDLKAEGPAVVPCLSGLPLVYDCYVHSIPESNIGVVYAWEHGGKWKITAERKISIRLNCSGTHVFNVKAWNGLNQVATSFSVKTILLISQVDLTASTSVAGKPSSIHISYNGTPTVNVSVSFGDGAQESFTTSKPLADTSSNSVFDVTLQHQYPSRGHYAIHVNVSNEVGWMTSENIADVGEPITGAVLTLMSRTPVALLHESVIVQATVATGTELIFNWDFGDDDGNQYTSVESSSKSSLARHTYGIAKTYNISVSITNRYHDKPVTVYLSTPVQAVERISHLRLYTVGNIHAIPLLKDADREHQGPSSREVMSTPIVFFEAQVYWGSDVEFLFDLGDGNKTLVPAQLDMLSLHPTARCGHVYNREGVYTVKVTASNPLGIADATLDGPFYVQIPPTELKLNRKYYINLLGEPIILKSTIASGTNISYDWCVGNNECYKNAGPEITLNFDKTGKYNISVQAYNQVTDLSHYSDRLHASTNVYVQEPLQAVEICIMLKDTTVCEGNDIDMPLDEKVVLLANALPASEVALRFIWDLGLGELRKTNSPSIHHNYREPGVFAVNVTAQNHISSVSSGKVVIRLVQRVGNLTSIRHQPSILVNCTASFHALYWFGTNLTFQWDFGDGTEVIFTHAANTQHTYKSTGEYWLTLHVHNKFSSAMIKTNVFVLKQHCQKPEVKFVDQSLEREIEKFQDALIEIDIATSCDLTRNVVYEWKILKITEDPLGTVEINYFPLELLKQRQLIIPSNVLPVGKFIVELKVKMNGTMVYVVEKTEINIIPSKLIAFWEGGIWRTVGCKDSISLRVISNINSTDEGFSIHWHCSTVHSAQHSCFKTRQSSGSLSLSDPHIHFPLDELNSASTMKSFKLSIWHEEEIQLSSVQEIEIIEKPHTLPVIIKRIHHLSHEIRQDDKIVFLAICNKCQDTELEFYWKLWLVQDGNHNLYISKYNCVQADGSTFFIHADNTTENPTNDSGHWTSELPYLLSTGKEGSLEDEFPPFPPFLGFSESEKYDQPYIPDSHIKKAQRKRETSEEPIEILITEGKSTIPPLFPHPPVEGDVIYDESNHPRESDSFLISEQEEHFGSFAIHDSYDQVDEGHPGEAGSASERDQTGLRNLDLESEILEELGNGRIIGTGKINTDSQDFPNPYNAGDTVKDSRYKSIAPHLARQPRVHYPFQPYTVSPEYFVIEPGILKIGSTYIIEAYVENKDGLAGKAMDYVVMNIGPTNGRCTLMPLMGKEFETWFRLHCMEWKSDNMPLLYELRYSLMPNVSGHLVYSGLNGNSKFTLPAGLPQYNYSVYVDVIVRDSSGSGTRVCSIVREVLPKWDSLADMELFLNNETTNSLSLFNKMIGEQNLQAVLHHIHVWGKGLNRIMNTESTVRRKREVSINTIRGRLLHLVNSLRISNMVEAHQAISAVLALLEISSEIPLTELLISFQAVKKFQDKNVLGIIPLDDFQESIIRVVSQIISAAVEKMLTAESSQFLKLKSLIEKCKSVITNIMKEKLMKLLPNEKPFIVETSHLSALTGYLANGNTLLEIEFGKTQIVIDHQVYVDIFNITNSHFCRKNYAYSCGCVGITAESYTKNLYINEIAHGYIGLPVSGSVSSLVFTSCDTHEPIELQRPNIEFRLNRQQVDPGKQYTLHNRNIHIHQLNLTKEHIDRALLFSIHMLNVEDKGLFPLQLLFSFNAPPQPNKYMKKEVFQHGDKHIKLLIPADLLKETGLYYFAILDAKYISHSQQNDNLLPVIYTLSVSLEQCFFWNGKNELWSSEGCTVSGTTEIDRIHCRCQKLGPIGYTAQMLSAELQTISVDKYLGSTMNVFPIIFIFLVYIILLLFCHFFGTNDRRKMPLIVLKDNNHKQGYLIIIETGSYWNAGTTAMVCIVLHGESGMSETTPLFSSRDSSLIFQRSSINTFYVSTHTSLGHLWKIQIWHNNSGSSPCWYLKNITVFDMSTGRSYYFECEQWLSVEEEDGQIETEIPLKETFYSFARIYQEKFLNYMADYHLWSSVYSKPPNSSFTRIQRLTCCLSLTMTSAAIIALWYKHGNNQHYFNYSMLDTSWQAVVIGVVSGILTMLPHHFLSLLFRNSSVPQTTLLNYFHPLFSGWSWKSIYCNYQQKDANSTVNSVEPFSSVNSGSIYSSDSLSHYDDSVEYADDGSEGYTDGEHADMMSNNLDDLNTFIKNQYGYYSSWESYGGISTENEFCELNKKRDLLPEHLKSDSLKTNGTIADIRRMQDINRSDQTSSGFEDWQEKAATDNTDIDEYLNSVPNILFAKRHQLKLPSWVQSFSWFLVLIFSGISTYVTIIYVYRFGNQYFNHWLQSLFYSILCSIFVLHPLWVSLLAFFASMKSWSPADISTYILSRFDTSLLDELCRVDYQFKISEELFESEDEKLMKRQRSRYLRYLRPPPESTLIQARIKALKTKHTIFAVKGISASVVMFVLLLIMAFGNDSSHNFHQKASIEKTFLRTRLPVTSVKSHTEWWNWIKYDFLDAFYGNSDINGVLYKDPKVGMLFSTGSISVAGPVIHSYSAAPQPCFELTKYFYSNECSLNENKRSETLDESDNYKFFQGKHGYYNSNSQPVLLEATRKEAYEHLNQLYNKHWLNNETRAIVVEFLLYNPTVAIFTSVTIAVEFIAAGGTIISILILPTHLHLYNTYYGTLILASHFIFQILVFWILKKELWKLWKTGRLYWSSPWKFLQMSFCSLSLSYTACTIFRTVLVASSLHRQEQSLQEFCSDIRNIAEWDQILKGELGLLIFIHMIGWLEYLHTSSRIGQFVQAFGFVQKDIIILLGFFFISLFSFAHVGNLAFGSDEFIMKNPILQAFQMIRFVLRQSPATKYSNIKSLPAELYTLSVLFGMLSVTMIGFAMMKAIIIRSKRHIKPKKDVFINIHETMQLVQEKILHFLGLSKKRDLQYREISIPPAELLLMELESLVDEVFTYANRLFTDSDPNYMVSNDENKKKQNIEKSPAENQLADTCNSHQVIAELHYCSPAQSLCDENICLENDKMNTPKEENMLNECSSSKTLST